MLNLIFYINTRAKDAGELIRLVNKLDVQNQSWSIKRKFISSRKRASEPHRLVIGEEVALGLSEIEKLLQSKNVSSYWLTAELASQEVEKWPAWKRGDYSQLPRQPVQA